MGFTMPNFYWVNQGATYKEELQARCLWAPNVDAKGAKLSHWETMDLLTAGDIVFTYSSGYLRGLAVVDSAAVPMLKPFAAGTPYSISQGGRIVFCTYTTAATAVAFEKIISTADLKAQLSSGTNPVLTSAGKVAQKYLCPISSSAATELNVLLGGNAHPASFGFAASSSVPKAIDATTIKAIVDARVGQGRFRTELEKAFGNACPITRLNVLPLLRASHIKPWIASSNSERLDPDNGILLAAGIDAAFDKGYIGFDPETGALLIKNGITSTELAHLGVPANAVLPAGFLTPGRKAYLQHHRTQHKL
jgi:putative restriction endonuclease